jgi:hypothetical protein
MKTINLLIALFVLTLGLSAQGVIVVLGSTGISTHTTLKAGVDSASNGDFIYVPGGTFEVNNLTINKEVHLFGAGHYPDSTAATGRTIINGNIIFHAGSDNSEIQGFYLNSRISMSLTNSMSNVKNILISRCNIHELNLSFKDDLNAHVGANNILVKECIIRTNTYIATSQDILFNNCIFGGAIQNITGKVEFNHCVFLYYAPTAYYKLFNACSSGVVRNSIIIQPNNASLAESNSGQPNIFYNCIMPASSYINNSSANFYNCATYIDDTKKIMKNVASNNFDYAYDFHLTEFSAARGIGAAGVDCGIYGGSNPYKEGAVPSNPHIQSIIVPSRTDNQGKLNIQVKVKAQEN